MFLNTDILFTTTAGVCGREITDYLGILIEREAMPAVLDTCELLYAMDARSASLAAAMNARAADIGADAVIGVDFKMDVSGNTLIFTMTGNAVRLRDAVAPEAEEEFAEIKALEAEEEEFAELEEELAEIEALEKEIAEIEALDAEEEEIGEIFVFEAEELQEEAVSWLCASCGTENDLQYRFCPRCGEMRSFDWKCEACGQENPAEYKFCPGCGRPCNG